jgi:hypothetical protein
MGYAFVMGPCWSCGVVFTYNPLHVPSVLVNSQGFIDPAGRREPICQNCMTLANEKRKAAGMPPHAIHPEAYEPVDEAELP